MPTIKKLYISSGVAVTAPTDLTSESSTVKIQPYADDAAFVTANGTAQEGDIYINTTIEGLRMYSAGAWRSVAMLSDPADATKVWAVDSTGATTGTSATFDFNQTASRVYAFPDVDGIVGLVPAAGPVRSNGSVLSSGDTDLASEVTGVLPIANGGTGEITANDALNALLPTQTANNGMYLQTDGTNTTWAPASGGGSESIVSVTSANYTVLDGDGYTTILVTTGASNRTITLPALASNTSRVIRVKKIDTGAGTVIIDGDSAETIEAASTYTLYAVNQAVEIQADAEWKILNRLSPSYIDTTARAANSSGYGSFAAVRREIYEAYQTYTGQWRLKFSLTFAGGSATPGNSFEYTITGVTFKNVSDYDQPIPATAGVSGFNQSGAISAFAITNTNTVRAYTTNSPQPNLFFWSFNGDVELESQPAWV